MTGTDLIGYVRDAVLATLTLLIAFGVDLTDAQVAGVLGFVLAIVTFGAYVRSRFVKGDGTPAGESK